MNQIVFLWTTQVYPCCHSLQPTAVIFTHGINLFMFTSYLTLTASHPSWHRIVKFISLILSCALLWVCALEGAQNHIWIPTTELSKLCSPMNYHLFSNSFFESQLYILLCLLSSVQSDILVCIALGPIFFNAKISLSFL